jgi:hypothetical protein
MRSLPAAASDLRVKMNTVYNPARPEDIHSGRKIGWESRLKSVRRRGQVDSSGQFIR